MNIIFVRFIGSLAALLMLFMAPVRAELILPGEKLVIEFHFSSPPIAFFGADTDMLVVSGGSNSNAAHPIEVSLFNGNTLLGTVITPFRSSWGFVAPTSLWTGIEVVTIDFTSISDGSIQGRFELVPQFTGPSDFLNVSLSFDVGHAQNDIGSRINAVPAPTIDSVSVVPVAPSYSCVGFESPMDSGAVKVKKNRVLPHKGQLLDGMGSPLNDLDIAAAPVIQVIFDDGVLPAEDVSDDALSAGAGTDGNQFEFLDNTWQFNLKTRTYTSAGTYTSTMVSGDQAEYLIDSTCEAIFVID